MRSRKGIPWCPGPRSGPCSCCWTGKGGIATATSRPKIAVLNPSAHLGGAEISLLELVGRLRDVFEFHIITPGEGPLKEKAEALGAHVWAVTWPEVILRTGEAEKKPGLTRLALVAMFASRLILEISRLLRKIRADVLITNGIKCHILGAVVPRGRRVPLIWYLRDGLEERAISRKLLSLLSFRCDTAICISRYIAGEMKKEIPASLSVHVLYNIVDPEKFRPGLPLPSDLHKGDGEIWFGMVGAVTGLKGQDYFLEAAGKIADALPSARFLIVGGNFYSTSENSAYREKLNDMASKPSLRGKVMFLGFRDDVPAIVSNLDVLVQSNRGPEGLGRSVLEAMASGIPVISVDRWGPGELVIDGVTGMLFHPGDTSSLAEKMLVLGKNAGIRDRFGANGRTWVLENLSSEKIVAGFRDIAAGLFR